MEDTSQGTTLLKFEGVVSAVALHFQWQPHAPDKRKEEHLTSPATKTSRQPSCSPNMLPGQSAASCLERACKVRMRIPANRRSGTKEPGGTHLRLHESLPRAPAVESRHGHSECFSWAHLLVEGNLLKEGRWLLHQMGQASSSRVQTAPAAAVVM